MIQHNDRTLSQFLEQVYLGYRIGLKPETIKNLRRHVRQLDEWAGHPVRVSELDDLFVSRFLASLIAVGRSPYTVNNTRDAILGLWRMAAKRHYTQTAPEDVEKLRLPQERPEAWTLAEIERLLATCVAWRGVLNGLPAAWW